jgi:hypothetical protein
LNSGLLQINRSKPTISLLTKQGEWVNGIKFVTLIKMNSTLEKPASNLNVEGLFLKTLEQFCNFVS